MCAVLYGFPFFYSFYFVSWNAQRSASWIHYTSIGLWRLLLLSLFIQKQPLRMIEQSTWARRKERRRSLLTRNRQKFFDFQEEKHTLPLATPHHHHHQKRKFLDIFVLFCFTPHFYSKKKKENLRSSTISVDSFRHKEKYHKYKREKGQQQTNSTTKNDLITPKI